MKHIVRNNEFLLGSDGELYWRLKKTLIISDLHLGKTKHFKKNGVQIPALANENNYWRLSELISKYEVSRVLILGDLFHSEYNDDWEKFIDFKNNYSEIDWELVQGNHDVLSVDDYKRAGLVVYNELVESDLIFTHEPIEKEHSCYNICGHIHPAVRIKGAALQSLRLPCFYFGIATAILPAFGEFTGTHTIKPEKNSKVFVIAEKEVIELN